MNRKEPKYLEWIRRQPCQECGKPGPSDPHHIASDLHQSGMGMKAPDLLAMPLCRMCHSSHHGKPEGWRDNQRGWLLMTIINALEQGILVFDGDSVSL